MTGICGEWSRAPAGCLSRGFAMQTWLNGLRSCLGWGGDSSGPTEHCIFSHAFDRCGLRHITLVVVSSNLRVCITVVNCRLSLYADSSVELREASAVFGRMLSTMTSSDAVTMFTESVCQKHWLQIVAVTFRKSNHFCHHGLPVWGLKLEIWNFRPELLYNIGTFHDSLINTVWQCHGCNDVM